MYVVVLNTANDERAYDVVHIVLAHKTADVGARLDAPTAEVRVLEQLDFVTGPHADGGHLVVAYRIVHPIYVIPSFARDVLASSSEVAVFEHGSERTSAAATTCAAARGELRIRFENRPTERYVDVPPVAVADGVFHRKSAVTISS